MTDLGLIIPETTLLVLTCAVLLIDVYRRQESNVVTFWAAIVSILVVLSLMALFFPDGSTIAFSGMVKLDPMGTVLKAFALVLVLLSFFYARDYYDKNREQVSEYYILSLFATTGMLVLISANSLLTVYLGLELLSLSLYSMVAMRRDSIESSEAAMKYFVLGALASGMLLYGMSILYGVSGTLQLHELLVSSGATGQQRVLMVFGVVFVIVGIAFKLGVVPFHMWLPDVYQGSSTPVTLFIGTAPKIAAFAMAIRLLADGLQGLAEEWSAMLIILSVLSMAIGNIVAIAQTNIKRMLAYSTIAHMGFLLLGILAASNSGYASSMFYVIVYALMSMGAFGTVILLSRSDTEADQIADFSGLSKRSPWFGFIMLVLMFSMAGVPPFAGFWAKWYVLKEVIAAGHVWLAGVAVLFSVIGAYYYVRIVKLMYFDASRDRKALEASQDMKLVLSVNGLAIFLMGVLPGALMSICVIVTIPYSG
ncbi:MAG: NADH-quinone oxidoreductase subunit NuoN [Gammaproteobacteria bacterium]|nr:NADH-quinone oxidoreductase subunit NuoN [Gammaproteobacteria bacterium]